LNRPVIFKKIPGIAGELEELNTILAVSPEEEDTHNMQFGESGEVE
jgi:hypothetical protein